MKIEKIPIDNKRNSFTGEVCEVASFNIETGEIFPALKEGSAADKKEPMIPIPKPKNQAEKGRD
nr:Uncharacterized protein A9P81_3779 [Leptospira interrogans serovar Copenhageni/Icterohaemorrhagiae]